MGQSDVRGRPRGSPLPLPESALRAGESVSGVAEVVLQDTKVRGIHYQVVVEVRRLHSTLPKLALESVEVGGVDYVVCIGVPTPLSAELLCGMPSADDQIAAISR